MPFDVVETEPEARAAPTAMISYERPKRRGASAKTLDRVGVRPQLHITLPTTICGIGKAKSHVLLIGKGPDKGKARIKASAAEAKGAVVPKEMKHSFTWKFGFVPSLGVEAAAAERVLARKIGDDEFEIDLPEWWK